jgi:hypothetical protein
MGFLDKVKETAGKAAEQAKHVTSVAQEKIDDARLTKKANDLYEEIGRLIVAQKRGSAPADIDAQIDAKVTEITDIEKQLEANNVEAPSGDAAATAAPDAASPSPPPVPENVPMAPPPPPGS